MKLYHIANWSQRFETAETRRLDCLRWVPTPNKHHGLGYRRITMEKDGLTLFGAWNAILQTASRCPKATRGELSSDGVPMTAEDLAVMTGFPKQAFERALEFFSDPRMGWLTVTSVDSGENPDRPSSAPDRPSAAPDRSGENLGRSSRMEGNGREGIEEKVEKEYIPPALAARVGGWFNRKPSTQWTDKELKALAKVEKLATSDEDLAILEAYYTAPINQVDDFRRRDIITLLNNWNGEIDRAKKWQQRPGIRPPSQTDYQKEIEIWQQHRAATATNPSPTTPLKSLATPLPLPPASAPSATQP